MSKKEKALVAGTTKTIKRTERPVKIAHLYYIAWLMAFATVISGWHIKDAWDGVVTIMCGIATVLIFNEMIKEI